MENQRREVVITTGSSGYIGKKIIERLARKFTMVGLDKDGNPFQLPQAECICCDITSEQSITSAMRRVQYAYGDTIASVIHLAAYYDFSGKPSPLYEEVTVKGTEKFLRVLQDFNVEQFIFSSTNLVYKPTVPGRKINEHCPVEPNWDYPQSKANTEELIAESRGHIPTATLRLAGVYDDEGHSIPIANQIQRIYEKQLISHFYSGDLSHGNIFLHMEDLLDALERTVLKRKELPEEIVFNIGEPETPSYEDLQNEIGKRLHGEQWKTFEVPEGLAKVGAWTMNVFGDSFIKPWMIDRADDHYEFDITRAKNLLGWEPKHRLMGTLPAIIQNLKNDPARWYREHHLEMPSRLEKKEEQAESRR